MFGLFIALAATTSAAPAARPAPAKPPVVTSIAKKPDMSPEQLMAVVTRMMDKLFPRGPEPEPARLAAARVTMQTLLPDGTYGEGFDRLIDTAVDNGLAMSEADWVALIPDIKKKKGDSPSTVPLRAKLAQEDPNAEAKMAAARAFLRTTLLKVGATFEPRLREGMARTLARRFDVAQLAQINAFYATPTGQAYGRATFGLMFEPEVIRGFYDALPDMMKLAPAIAKDAEQLAATIDAKGDDKKKPETLDKTHRAQ
ncbi:DUF2059 domain-containing protein [Sphingomonas sp. ASV193]|uniref:DUF2059 domain-containing protein n=1 Tax=Sphingomonas sp. ASV193 TaxID=3144405 RepID=UPI0032E8C371